MQKLSESFSPQSYSYTYLLYLLGILSWKMKHVRDKQLRKERKQWVF
ncbi:hypothetical protein DB29_02479 [Shouchella clausii]|nr:hypothetical protein DB29_02479 [Shouchella clausii]